MNPFSFFLLLLIVVPVVEIYFLIQVGGAIGAFSTVVLIIVTAVLGAYLFRLQGLSTVKRVQASLSRGEIPAVEMIEGAMLLVSGALLLTPGFVTDIVGFVCLMPALRRKFAISILESQLINQSSFQSGGFQQQGRDNNDDNSNIIEGEFKREDEPEELDKKD
ncbi:MAG: exlusion protein FxsA [Cycloclasticus sp. symbiont of Bathymodiolus heckerae]|nr:MAG: exlusion protein FxsA [Cycloclasticus sp. symbiont of Bathymodiolus heckerae]